MADNTVDRIVIEISTKDSAAKSELSAMIAKLHGIKSAGAAIKPAVKPAFDSIKRGSMSASKSLGKIGGGLKNLAAMFKRRLLYRAMNAVISAVANGFKQGTTNVYQFSKAIDGRLAGSLDRMATSSLYLKNSLGAMAAPLINIVAPAFEFVIGKVVDLFNAVNQLFAKLSGASTWTKALLYPKEYAEAADDATAANKRLKKSLLAIDEINALTDNSKHGGGASSSHDDYSSMFEEVPLGDDFENPLADFFEPFKAAWEKVGQPLVDSIGKAFESFKPLFSSIKQSFSSVFSNGSGQESVEHILGILRGIADTITGINESWTRAWNEDDNGTKLIQSMSDIFNEIAGTIETIVDDTSEWAGELDFAPLIQSVTESLQAIRPVLSLIGAVVSWLHKIIVLPFFKWLLESGLPETINGLTGLLQFFNGPFTGDFEGGIKGFWNFLKLQLGGPLWSLLGSVFSPVVQWFDENVLQPLEPLFTFIWDEKIKPIVTGVWDDIKAVWEKVSGWFDENVTQPIWRFFEPIFTDIGVLASGCWEIIKTVWNFAANWFNENVISPISNWFKGVWDKVEGWASDAWEGIKSVFSTVSTWFEETFGEAWRKVVEVFSPLGEVFEDIKNGVASVFTTVVNGLIRGINWVIAKPFQGINSMIKKLRETKIVGITPFSGLQDLTVPEIPLLKIEAKAEGGMVDAGTAFIAGEAGAEVVANIGHRTGVMNIDQMRESVAQGVVEANAEQNSLLREEIRILRMLLEKDIDVKAYVGTDDVIGGLRRKNRRDGKTIVPIGT